MVLSGRLGKVTHCENGVGLNKSRTELWEEPRSKMLWPHIFLQVLSHGEIVEHTSVRSRGLPIHDQEIIVVTQDRSDSHC